MINAHMAKSVCTCMLLSGAQLTRGVVLATRTAAG
jgi:hypothetical protein